MPKQTDTLYCPKSLLFIFLHVSLNSLTVNPLFYLCLVIGRCDNKVHEVVNLLVTVTCYNSFTQCRSIGCIIVISWDVNSDRYRAKK